MDKYCSPAVPVSPLERIFHAVLFEVLITLANVVFLWLFYPLQPLEAGLTALLVSVLAMAWNYLFNLIFDRLFGPDRMSRSWTLRVWHAVTFELSLTLACIPLVCWLMQVSWQEALMLEIGMVGLILILTLFYNRLFDCYRVRLIGAYPDKQNAS